MDEFICNFCNSKFSNKSNLVTHQKNAKKCLTIQNKENNEYICTYCDKNFTSKQNFSKHACIEKINILNEEIQKLKEKLIEKDNEIETIKNQKNDINELLKLSQDILHNINSHDVILNKIDKTIQEKRIYDYKTEIEEIYKRNYLPIKNPFKK